MTEKIIEVFDKTIEDVADVIAEHLTVSESTFAHWYTKEFRIQFENNLKELKKTTDGGMNGN